ncbi:MAG: phosphopentomutase [Candidatus Woesearchaeota archaeon]
MRIFLIVLDGFGVGKTPDAKSYKEGEANTFLNIEKQKPFNIPSLELMGIRSIDGINQNLIHNTQVKGKFARLMPKSIGKDTLTGHLEMAGIISKTPYQVFNKKIPRSELKKYKKATGLKFIGKKAASGTHIIKRLGKRHLRSKKPIIYTSADSVVQVAAHDSVYSIDKLYDICNQIRKVTNVGRVIARPFSTKGNKFYRLENRKDFGLEIHGQTLLDKLKKKGVEVTSVGKIFDIFNGRSIDNKVEGKTNKKAILNIENKVLEQTKNKSKIKDQFIFVNLVDTDMVYGHRNDVEGYRNSIEQSDKHIANIIKNLDAEDYLIVTADHGCDPTIKSSTDHTREYVPFLMYNKKFKKGKNLKTIKGFDYIQRQVIQIFNKNRQKEK